MSRSVRGFYNAHATLEWERLDLPLCRVEFASTMQLIGKYFPPKGRVCDIGSGPGRYSLALARKGYIVSLFDLSEAEIRLAQQQFDDQQLTAEQFVVGNAEDLSVFDSASFDAALMLGPMYHIVDGKRRNKALRELFRILKPGGTAIVSYLNSWGLIKTGLNDFPSRFCDIEFLRSLAGEKVFLGEELAGFTESYWATPPLALSEVEDAALKVIGYAGAESFANGLGILLGRLAQENAVAYENVVSVAAETCELPQYRDGTDHLHIVVRKD